MVGAFTDFDVSSASYLSQALESLKTEKANFDKKINLENKASR